MNSSNQPQPSPSEDSLPVFNPGLIGWAIAALALGILSVTFNTSAMVLGAGLLAKCFAVVVGTVLGWIGAVVGDAIRKFAHPDAVFTSGGLLSLLWIKIFWRVGPQLIGLVAGVMVGCALVLR
jgi:putative Mn2+ efflux pump MntP